MVRQCVRFWVHDGEKRLSTDQPVFEASGVSVRTDVLRSARASSCGPLNLMRRRDPPLIFFFFCVLRDPKSDVKRSSFPRLNEGIVGVIHRRSAQVDFPPVAEMLSFLWHSVSPFCEFD